MPRQVTLVAGGVGERVLVSVEQALRSRQQVVAIDTVFDEPLRRLGSTHSRLLLARADYLDEAAVERVLHQCAERGTLRTVVLIDDPVRPLDTGSVVRPLHDVRRAALHWIGLCNIVRLSAERMATNPVRDRRRGRIVHVTTADAAPDLTDALANTLRPWQITAERSVPA